MIEQPSPKVYDELLSIWEEAVRSTHHFLTEADIQFYNLLDTSSENTISLFMRV